MNLKHTYVSTVLGALLMLGAFAQAQEETTAEPLELTRLREQFQTRVDQEMIPWREKYKKELQKLEDRLVDERRLSEALVVKKEREGSKLESDGGSARTPAATSFKTPGELKKYLKGKVWLVYSVDDKNRETIIDLYKFTGDEDVYCMTARKKFQYNASSAKSVTIMETSAKIELDVDPSKGHASADHMGKKYQFVLANFP